MRGKIGKITRIREKGLDMKAWERYYNRHQQEHKRRKLKAIKLAFEIDSFNEIFKKLGCSPTTLSQWYDIYLKEGLDGLVKDIARPKPERLTIKQKHELAQMILDKHPVDYGIDAYIWTAKTIKELVMKQFNVDYKQIGIYNLLDRMGLSHQKAHKDYANADRKQQQEFLDALKKTD
jgi:transposase